MEHLPILQELFEADTKIFLFLGLALALVLGSRLKKLKTQGLCLAAAAGCYAVCELLCILLAGSFLAEMVFLFAGTAALGCAAGMLVAFLFGLVGGR